MTFFLGFLCLMALLNYFTAIRMEKVRIRETANRISLLIPLRNEGSRVTELLNNLAKLSSSNVEIILLNDESTDDTWEKLQKSTDKEIRAIQGEPLPEGWVGKPWGCWQLSQAASGDILLFCDADVSIGSHAIQKTVSLIEEHHVDALTALPYQELPTLFEKAIIPFVMHLPILGLLPLRWISHLKSPSLVLANGQWFAIRRTAYLKIDGHRSVSHSLLEDMELARKLVRDGFTVLPVLATRDISVRMYDSWKTMKEGFTKNLYLLSGGVSWAVALVFAISAWIYLVPFINAGEEISGAGEALLLLLLFRTVAALTFRVSPGSVWLHPVGALGFLWLLARSWLAHFRNQVLWRGRAVQTAN